MEAYGADDLRGAAEILPGRLYFHCLQQPMTLTTAPPNSICVHLDADLIYEPFCADFGPCNLAHSWRFCQRVNELLQRVRSAGGRRGTGVAGCPRRRQQSGQRPAGVAREVGEEQIYTLLVTRAAPAAPRPARRRPTAAVCTCWWARTRTSAPTLPR